MSNESDDFTTLVRMVSPIEAQILAARLEVEGIPASLADVHLVQTHSLLTLALGGVRILVQESRLAEAHNVMKRWNAGEFALGEEWPDSDC